MLGFTRSIASHAPASGPPSEFLPGYLRLLERPPSPLPRLLLYWLLVLLTLVVLWLAFGRLDIVAVAEGKLTPRTSLKIVQPADAGTVREIAVGEGEIVLPGQVLVRLDPGIHEAETRALQGELVQRSLQLRRIDAEVAQTPFVRTTGDADDAFARADAQYQANKASHADALAQESAAVARIAQELRAAIEVQSKLHRTVPIYQTTAERYRKLQAEGFVSELAALERQRDRIEKEQDSRAQDHTVESLKAGLAQAQRRMVHVSSSHRQQLHGERAQAAGQRVRLQEELAKQLLRAEAVELRAPQAGVVKDLATHTVGTVVAAGTVLLTLVPLGEELQGDVMVRNNDVGFVRVGQRAKVKLATYPFQKYGLLEGTVVHVSVDASETPTHSRGAVSDPEASSAAAGNGYRARIALAVQHLPFAGRALPLASGMQTAAEIHLGERTLLEYLLAPVQKAWHEAARER